MHPGRGHTATAAGDLGANQGPRGVNAQGAPKYGNGNDWNWDDLGRARVVNDYYSGLLTDAAAVEMGQGEPAARPYSWIRAERHERTHAC